MGIRHMTKAERAEAVSMYLNDKIVVEEIAEKFGRSRETIRRLMKRTPGLQRRTQAWKPARETNQELQRQLQRANAIIGWMMPYIGSMCPPPDGLYDLNLHCCENKVPVYGRETKGWPINQRIAA